MLNSLYMLYVMTGICANVCSIVICLKNNWK
jgi:hypothetical protein